MLDFGLLFVAGICNFLLGLLGFRLSTRRVQQSQKAHYEWAFIIIGLVGLASIVWSGYRSVNVQDGIADGIRLIEAKLGITTLTNNRNTTKQQLGGFYVEGEKLANDGPSSREPEEYKKYQGAVADWRQRTVAWLSQNMAPTAAAKFLDW
jgi:hypothetical protein